MSSPDFDQIIAQEKKVLLSIKEQGEKTIPELKRVTAAYIRELAVKLLKSYFSHKTQAAKNLGTEKMEELKGEFQGFLVSLPEQTSKRFDESQIWLHRVAIPDSAISDMTYSYQFEQRSKKNLDQAIRDLIGTVGSLLIKYGFVNLEEDFTWKMTPGGFPQYALDLPSQGMDHYRALNKLMEQYKDILIEYVYAIQSLRKAEQGRDAADAGGFNY